MDVPSIYRRGYARARRRAPELADKYARHLSVADPLADDAVEALAGVRAGHRFIQAGMDRDENGLAGAPTALREFFEHVETPPGWWRPEAVHAGCRAFHANSDLFIPAFFVVTLRNAATMISKAFYATGRVRTEHGLRRIRQNTRHFIEIMLPGALNRDNEGWKLSVRIRLVHAQVRRLLRRYGEWDPATFGVPISSAHVGLSAANFSASMLQEAQRLGAKLDAEARAGFMQTWRYASWLVGTPEALLFEGDEAATLEFRDVAVACEPPPNEESAVIANRLVQALPLVAGLTDAAERDHFEKHAYRVSRALLGHRLADQLDFPRMATSGLLGWMRFKRRAHDSLHRMAPRAAARWWRENFMFLLDASMIGDLSYRLPDRLKAESASPW